VQIGIVEFLDIWQQGKISNDVPHLAQLAEPLLDNMV